MEKVDATVAVDLLEEVDVAMAADLLEEVDAAAEGVVIGLVAVRMLDRLIAVMARVTSYHLKAVVRGPMFPLLLLHELLLAMLLLLLLREFWVMQDAK